MGIRRLIICLTAIVLMVMLCVPAGIGETAADVYVRSAPLVRSNKVMDGMVRVWLSSVGNISNLDITVTGRYSVNGNTSMTLTTGDQVDITFNKSTGQITMTLDGVSYAMGKEMRLRRHQANGTSGVSIAQSRYPNNIHLGDLQLIAVKTDSGYRLYPIVHVYLEYYLYGVVPYEMSASWPLEALKAQAVAARTYAVRRLVGTRGELYDLSDTTSDQVYYGHKGSQSNATIAVDETKGIVAMNNGEFTGTYYTASNGGQTEAVKNAWGGTEYPYMGVKDDPFDAMNTASVRRKLTIYSDFDHASQNTALAALLTEKAQAQLGANAVIQTINSVTPHTPKYASPSRLYTKMDFGVTVQLGSATQEAVLSFDIFSDLEAALSMNINSSTKNELWSVETADEGFKLTVGRWGHGIGLSQRGAQQMANMGYTYDQILGFYYEGCERVQYTFTHTILSAGSSNEITSTEPPAEISPAVKDQATLSLPGVTDVAALRYTAKSDGKVLTGIPNGSSVTVLAKGEDWTLVRYGEINGYLPTADLIFTATPPTSTTETPTVITLWGTVTGTNSLNFRTGPGTDYKVQGSLSSGAILCILGTEGSWARVQYGAQVGYVSPTYLTTHNTYPGQTTQTDRTAMVSLKDASAAAPLLASPATGATVIYQITHGTQVEVLSNDGTWCRVDVGGLEGYVLASQLDFDASGTPPTDVPGTQGDTAIVNSNASTLNLREGPSTSYALIAEIPKGTRIVVTTYGSEWCAVKWGTLSGYVMTKYLLFEEDETPAPPPESGDDPTPTPTPTPTPPPENMAWVMLTVNYINLRQTADPDGAIITTIPTGDELIVLNKGSTWCYVQHGSLTGYVLTRNLTFSQPLPSIGIMYVDTDVDPLSMRDKPSTSNTTILTRIPRGEPVMLLEDLGDWCHVQYGAYVGYCSKQYLSYTKPADYEPDDTAIYDPTLTDASGWTATVHTDDGAKLTAHQWCSLQAEELFTVPDGSSVTLLQKGDIWCKIKYKGETGYCLTKKLTLTAPAAE